MARLYTQTLLLLISFFSLSLPAQVSFSNMNSMLPDGESHSGVAIAVTDMNGDGLDDIVRLKNGRSLEIKYQQSSGSFTTYDFGPVSNQSQWSMCVADVDNNGYNDVISGGAYDEVKLVKATEDGSVYEMSYLPGPGVFVQGTNLVDINNDGYIDYFACHDDGESRIWANDSLGGFIPADDWIDMATVPESDNSGNYGSVWTDFDNDGDLDLYIAKCRQGVNNPNDPRRINVLFVNDGMGNYTEMADSFNLKIGAQSWTADFQDIDNDGDLDCFITNHDVPSMLLENDGTGKFTDITAGSGISINGLPIQGVMRDFDNDGFVDILVAGSRHFLFLNNGDKTFTSAPDIFDSNHMESFAIGDLNHDGFLDIYGGYANIYTNPSDIEDVLWLNNGDSGNHFLAVNLIGRQSNRNGIGARINIYYNGTEMQTREVRAGESYGIMNSLTQHFGLAQHTLVDSMVIHWPSGAVDQYFDLEVNQFLTIIEGTCISPEATVAVEGETLFCEGDSVALTAPPNFNYSWSTGDTTRSVVITEAGNYNVTISDGSACFGVSASVSVIVNPDETPSLTYAGDTLFCAGGVVIFTASEANSYLWPTGETTQSIEVIESGDYYVTIQGLCETFNSDTISVNVLPADQPEVQVVDYLDGEATFMVTGSNVYWYDSPEATAPFAEGNVLTMPVEGDTIIYAQNVEVYPGLVYNTGMAEHEGSNYSGNQYNGATFFDAFAPFTLRRVTVYTDTPGLRIIELQDADGNVLQSREVEIPQGTTTLDLAFAVEPGLGLQLTTNTENNNTQFGFNSPRLRRSSENVNYPYEVDGVLSIYDSNLGSDRYYYFFDWQIKEADRECESEWTPVVLTIVGIDDPNIEWDQLVTAPNPTDGRVQIEWPQIPVQKVTVRVLDATGRLVKSLQMAPGAPRSTLDISELAAGLYWLQLTDGEKIYGAKVVKQ